MDLPARTSCCGVLVAFVLIIVLVGCGSGAGAGSSSGASRNPPPSAGDFSLAVNTSTVDVAVGAVIPPIELSFTPIDGFSGSVNVTVSLPNGISCWIVPMSVCSGEIQSAGPSLFRYLASGTITPGQYTIVFTGTSGTLSHQISVMVEVSAPPPITVNRSGFVLTGNESPFPPHPGVIYDKLHDLIYVSDTQLCDIDVVSPSTLQIIKRIPVPSPAGLDLSPDNSILYVGSETQNFFEIATSSLEVVKRVPFQGDPTITDIYPTQIAALLDGTLMIVASCAINGECSPEIYLYSPGAKKIFQQLAPTQTIENIYRSADRTRVFMTPMDNGGVVGRYDVATRTLAFKQVSSNGFFVTDLAVKPDGSGLAGFTSQNTITFLDANLDVVGTFTTAHPNARGGLIYSPDGSRLYAPEGPQGSTNVYATIDVIDASTFKLLGQIPSLLVGGSVPPTIYGWDGESRLLGLSQFGLDLIDAGMAPETLPTDAPSASTGALMPKNPASGYTTTFGAGGFTGTPEITFNGIPATNVSIKSPSEIDLTAPALTNVAQANVAAFFPDGYFLYNAAGYSYKPTILFTDGDGSGQDGGGTLTIYGYGFDFGRSELSVAVGGNQATNLQYNGGHGDDLPTPVGILSVTVPPGTPGGANIVLNTPIGSATAPQKFTYAQRIDIPLPSMKAPFQMVLDKPRNRLLWTDYATNQLVVFSLNSDAIDQTIDLGSKPGGLALTPDGSKFLVILYGSGKLNVYDAATLTLLQQANTPTIEPPGEGADLHPIFVAAVANGKAFLLSNYDGFGGAPVYEYDIDSNTFTLRTDVTGDQSSMEAASADGSAAFVAASVWNSATDSFTPAANPTPTTGTGGDSPRALSGDGKVLSLFLTIFNREGWMNGILGGQNAMQLDFELNNIPGQQLNATGSLAYLLEKDRIRVYDVRHGQLVRTIVMPDGLSQTAINGLAVDPDGKALYILTQTGLTIMKFIDDPLSIGEVKASGKQITLLGSGFAPGAKVTIDGVAAPADVENSQHIVVTAASPSAGGHNISVVLPSGESYSLDNALDSLNGTPLANTGATGSGSTLNLATPKNESALRQRIARFKLQ